MALTRQQIADMRERQLHKDVLIPLFKAMNFRSVTLYDGGNLELGKDIVMWKEGELRERMNFGVVVKSEKISGKATGKGSAGEVYFQIMQCFNEPYSDFTSTEEQRIHRCWVVSSTEIKKEAINAIKGQLRNSNLDKVTDFIDGDTLWGLIQRYMPELGINEQLSSVQMQIDDLIKSDYYRVTANTKNEFFIEPKYPGADLEQPLTISALLEFDASKPEGQKALADWERHVKTGAPVTVKSPYLKEFNLPAFLRPLLSPNLDEMQLVVGQARTDRKIPFKFELLSRDGEVATLEYVELEVIQQGTEEVTLRNEQQSVPWRVTLIWNKKEKRFTFSFVFKGENPNVKQALQGLRFRYAMTKAGEFRIENLENGITIRETYTPTQQIKVNTFWLKLLEEMTFIQSKTSIPLRVPEGPINPKQAQPVFVTAHILRTGHATFNGKHLPIQSTVEQVKEALKRFSASPPPLLTLHMKDNQEFNLFGIDIPLGPAIMTCEKFHIAKSELARLRRKIEDGGHGEVIEYQLTIDGPLEVKYINWLPKQESDEILKLPIFDNPSQDSNTSKEMPRVRSEQSELKRPSKQGTKRTKLKKKGGKK